MYLFTILLSFFSSAEFIQNKADILNVTGLTETIIEKKTEQSLEAFLFYQDDGVSCGLDEYFIFGFTTTTKSLTVDQFTVVSDVVGQVNDCNGYEQFKCYTTWAKKDDQWNPLFTECDDDTVAGE